MPSDPRQLDFDAALAELIDRAGRPADINRLVAAAARLRAARGALNASEPTQPAEPACATVSWCSGGYSCSDWHPDVRGTLTDKLHFRSWVLADGPIAKVALGQAELPPGETPLPGEEDVTIWLDRRDGLHDSLEFTVDQAAALSDALATALGLVRQAER